MFDVSVPELCASEEQRLATLNSNKAHLVRRSHVPADGCTRHKCSYSNLYAPAPLCAGIATVATCGRMSNGCTGQARGEESSDHHAPMASLLACSYSNENTLPADSTWAGLAKIIALELPWSAHAVLACMDDVLQPHNNMSSYAQNEKTR